MIQHIFAAPRRHLLGFGAFVFCAWFSGWGCSSKSGCDSSQCAPGNQCISDGKETKCRLMCPVKDDGTGGQAVCPPNYHCFDAPIPYCVADAHPYQNLRGGLWGASCSPTGGFDNNPSCDSD